MATNQDTLNQLREAIDSVYQQRDLFQNSLTDDVISSQQLSESQLDKITKMKLNHSKVEILSLVNDAGELSNKALTAQVSFSQGMVSRYVKQLIKADLLVKVALPDNNKAYDLRVTDAGRVLAKQHDAMHIKMDTAYSAALSQFSEKRIAKTIEVLQALAETHLER
ncbi:hypothetical protein AYR62_11645 [Secundilactobacillus paracollinoides]|uniref:HTH marR-type domain-containing protein n=1 Tax=Secundilactobacillus paracollinoides TaxID=240427 RepID=A0A1B2IXT2_9LACO|nr:MarR family transcriptional regulator [Secundilactobacillus paracollinoides]ANZ60970.1 hypothetical protein AYR61_06180 [Secundilactobacillus paracollinoides]ANZ64663.1 hypothetical protein AYR62_11645 [Secundilactobacillus paracollinoides]ANZ66829.1 hypothetical protein AYR63_06550 [Secundilactobacillus paracollinoides]KRL80412.1 hypothetical protein FC17_GL003222 [Secundilactobacillus paracollinoides DSM 15502 = JCM 11969]